MAGQSSTSQRHEPQAVGLYSRTLIHTPVVRWIFSVRLRDQEHHEVAMIGDQFLAVNEIDATGRLRQLGRVDSFGSQIRSAAVIGTEAKYTPRLPPPLNFKVEKSTEALPESVPPQFLAIVTNDPPELRFMIANVDSTKELTFHERIRALPVMDGLLTQPGKLLAVDPDSRMLAVAAIERSLLVYRIKDLETLAAEYKDDLSEWNPVRDECLVEINGTILRMEFLQPDPAYPNQAVLVLIVAAQRRLVIQWYIWNLEDDLVPLSSSDLGPFSHPLPRGTCFSTTTGRVTNRMQSTARRSFSFLRSERPRFSWCITSIT